MKQRKPLSSHAIIRTAILAIMLCLAHEIGAAGLQPLPQNSPQAQWLREYSRSANALRNADPRLYDRMNARGQTTREGMSVRQTYPNPRDVNLSGMNVARAHRLSDRMVATVLHELHYNAQHGDLRKQLETKATVSRLTKAIATSGGDMPAATAGHQRAAASAAQKYAADFDRAVKEKNPIHAQQMLKTLVHELSNDPGNLRYGNSRVNSAIGKNFDPNYTTPPTPGRPRSMTPTSKEISDTLQNSKALSRQTIDRALTQNRDHGAPISSSHSVPLGSKRPAAPGPSSAPPSSKRLKQ